MEPLVTIEGYNMMQSTSQSRELLNNYYKEQGYQVITPKAHSVDETAAPVIATDPSKSTKQ